MAVAEAQPLGRRHRRPAAARHDLLVRPIAFSVVCAVDGSSVGNDAFGMWMVREAESKPWPKSRFWFCSISDCRILSSAARAGRGRAPPAATPPASA